MHHHRSLNLYPEVREMETEMKKASVNEIWNALKEDEVTFSTRRSADRSL